MAFLQVDVTYGEREFVAVVDDRTGEIDAVGLYEKGLSGKVDWSRFFSNRFHKFLESEIEQAGR